MSVHQARQLRKRMSQPEAMLWRHLRARPNALKFRRQHPSGPFVFDFYCHAASLAIEVDSYAHECGDRPARDLRRDAWARERRIETLRIAATDVRDNLESVIVLIVERGLQRTPPPLSERSPSPRNCGEDPQA